MCSSTLRSACVYLASIAALFLGGNCRAAQDASWNRVTEGHLTVYTQSDPSEACTLIHSFAELQNALTTASAFQIDNKAALKIVQFRSEKDFSPYRLNPGSSAFYQQTGRSEYIVLGDPQADHHEISFHEFTHFLLAHSGVTLPLWLNEGLADFYSTFQVSNGRVTFGRAVPGRLSVLRDHAWLPLQSLFAVTTTSSYYSEPDRMLLFYSESWALAHMLVASPAYGDRFPTFIRALRDGHSAVESLQLAYNKSLDAVQQDLRDYVDSQPLPLIEAALPSSPATPAADLSKKVSAAEMDITLADLNATNPAYRTGLETRLASAASQLPDNAEAEEALGYLALRQGRNPDARLHFQRAVDRHSSDGNVLFYLAHLDNEAGAPANQTLPLLQQALALKPDLSDARLEFALIATADGQFAQALDALRTIESLRPENAYVATYAKAYCYAHLDKAAEARAAGHEAQTLASNDHDRAEVAELLDFIAQNESDR